MIFYEGMFILDSNKVGQNLAGALEIVSSILKKYKIEIKYCEKWDEKKFSYPIKGQKRGVYVLTYFESVPEGIQKVYRECEISEDILRVLILSDEKNFRSKQYETLMQPVASEESDGGSE